MFQIWKFVKNSQVRMAVGIVDGNYNSYEEAHEAKAKMSPEQSNITLGVVEHIEDNSWKLCEGE